MQAVSTTSSLLCISTGDLAHPHICFWAMWTSAQLTMDHGLWKQTRWSQRFCQWSTVPHQVEVSPWGNFWLSWSSSWVFMTSLFVFHLCLTSVAGFITQLNQLSKELGRWVLREQGKHSFPMQLLIGKCEPCHELEIFLLWYLCFCWLMPYHGNLTWFWYGFALNVCCALPIHLFSVFLYFSRVCF